MTREIYQDTADHSGRDELSSENGEIGAVILYPEGWDAGSVSPGVEKSLRTVQRERDDLTTSTRLAIDPTTARKSRKRLGGKLSLPTIRVAAAGSSISAFNPT